MSTDGHGIYEALVGVRELHRQVSRLLGSADAYLTEEPRSLHKYVGSTALAYGTASLKQPHKWMPDIAFRYYTTPKADDIVIFVAVLMCPRSANNAPWKFTEPLVTSGWVRLNSPAPRKFSSYGWCKMITWTDWPRTGAPLSHWVLPPGEESTSKEQRCLAVPLIEVTDTDVLVERVLDPLIEAVVESTGEGG